MSRLAVTAALTIVVGLSACDRSKPKTEAPPSAPPPAELSGFVHEPGFDAQGFYRPEGVVKVGDLRLIHIVLGAPSDFEQWEQGKADSAFGPVVVQFEDTTVTPPEGAPDTAPTVMVAPKAYRVAPGQFQFLGTDAKLGEVKFEGTFDTAALAGAKATSASEGGAVLTGTLDVGGQRFEPVKFSFWAGD